MATNGTTGDGAADGESKQQREVGKMCTKAVRAFREVFGEDATPELGVYAPGRVNLMGGSIDYSGGPVVPVALHLVTVIVGRRSKTDACRVVTLARTDLITEENADHSFPVPSYPPDEPQKVAVGKPLWASYLKGVVALMNKNGDVPPFEAVIATSVPLGGGLSSSAALEVATYKFIEQLCPHLGQPNSKQAALLCQKAEHRYANVPCGLMDQFVAMMAQGGRPHALYIDCATQEVENIHLSDHDLVVLIINSEYRHNLAKGDKEGDKDYSSRRKTCEAISKKLGVQWLRDLSWRELEASKSELSDVEFKRATHAVTEIERSLQSKEVLKNGNYRQFGKFMNESHYSLRDNYEVTVKELDDIVSLVLEDRKGVYGCHLSGGGFGGSIVALLHRGAVEATKKRVMAGYESREGKQATFVECYPSGGAGVIPASSLRLPPTTTGQ